MFHKSTVYNEYKYHSYNRLGGMDFVKKGGGGGG